MYNNYNSPGRHPAMTPQSDGRRLVFPLSQWNGTFNTKHFLPSLVDYRCSLDDIQLFFNDVYYATKRLKAIRVANKLVIWSFVLYLFCFVFGIMIEMDNQDSLSYYQYEGETMVQYGDDDTGIILIIGGMFALIFINIYALVYRNQAKTQLFKQVVHVLERHKYGFLQKGLRWAVPENCQWLELWMDYRYFSPYYMQPYIPPMAIQGNHTQALTNAVNTQNLNLQRAQSTENSTANSANTANVSANNNAQGQNVPQGYPVFEVPAQQNVTENVVPNNQGQNVNRVGFVQPLPQYYGVQQPMGQYAYGYYQNPQLNEGLLGYQIPIQDSEAMRMMRPY